MPSKIHAMHVVASLIQGLDDMGVAPHVFVGAVAKKDLTARSLLREGVDHMNVGSVRALQCLSGQGIAPVAASSASVPFSKNASESCGNQEMTASAKSMRNRNGSTDFMT